MLNVINFQAVEGTPDMELKDKKVEKRAKIVKMERSMTDWQRLIQDAKKKENAWKFFREDGGGEVTEREDES